MRTTKITPKNIRRLVAADGYLTLNMPENALAEITDLPDMGPLEGPRRLLQGLALKRSGEQEAAIPHLEQAARQMPSAVRGFAWSELASCYRHMGNTELAEMAETLGGNRTYELRISLPFSELCIRSTEARSETV